MSTTRTKTFDLNSFRISGKPKRFFDNTNRGKYGGVTLVIELPSGQEIRVSAPAKSDGGGRKPYFSEQAFMKCGVVSIIGGVFSSYVSNKNNLPVFELKSGNIRNVLLGIDIGHNDAIVGGVVSAVSSENRRVMLDITYKKGIGKDADYGTRSVVVNVPSNMTLPSKGEEVIVSGELAVNKNGVVGVNAHTLTTVS